MINERRLRLSDIIQDLEIVMNSTKEKENIQRLQKAINTLQQHVTLRVNGTSITFITDNVDDVEIEETVYNTLTVQEVRPIIVPLSSESKDDNGVKYVDTKVVADYYGVTTETIRNWIKEKRISGKQLSGRGKWFIPREEFEYLKQKRENDDTEDDIKYLLGEDFNEDWDVELDNDE